MDKIFAVVVNWNQKEATKKCLESLGKSELPINIIVVDNASEDGSIVYLKTFFDQFKNILFLEVKENLGFAAGANLGVKKALKEGASLVFILNNDTIFKKNFLKPLINEFENDSGVGIVSPQINYLEDKNKIWYRGGKIDFLTLKIIHNYFGKENNASLAPFKTDFASGCAMMVKKDVFGKIGFFKERYFMFFEDADFSLRAGKAGFKIKVVPASKIYHAESMSIKNSPQKVYYLVRNGLFFGRENYPFYFLPWLYFYLFIRVLNNVLKRFFKPRNEELKAVFEGLTDFIKGNFGEKG